MKNERISSIIGIIIIISLFFIFSYFLQKYLDFFKTYFDIGIFGMFLFILIVALSIVLAPVSSVPLFPLATGLWGWVIAGVLGVAGWIIGAVIAFLLARRYGVSLVSKFFPMKKIHRFESKIPHENVFLSLVLLRMFIPFDGISYLFGLFSNMKLKSYTTATIIGLIPSTFLIAYLGSLPLIYILILSPIFLLVFFLGLLVAYRRLKKKRK